MRASGSRVPLSVLKFLMMNSCCTGSESGARACAEARCAASRVASIRIIRTVRLPMRAIDIDPGEHTLGRESHAASSGAW